MGRNWGVRKGEERRGTGKVMKVMNGVEFLELLPTTRSSWSFCYG